MPSPQFQFDFAPRMMLRLSELEQIIKQSRLMRTPPSRSTLIEMCEDGTLEANKTRFGWMVYEDSFENWARSFQHQRLAA